MPMTWILEGKGTGGQGDRGTGTHVQYSKCNIVRSVQKCSGVGVGGDAESREANRRLGRFGVAADAKRSTLRDGLLFRYVAAQRVVLHQDRARLGRRRAVGFGIDVARRFGGGVDEQPPFARPRRPSARRTAAAGRRRGA